MRAAMTSLLVLAVLWMLGASEVRASDEGPDARQGRGGGVVVGGTHPPSIPRQGHGRPPAEPLDRLGTYPYWFRYHHRYGYNDGIAPLPPPRVYLPPHSGRYRYYSVYPGSRRDGEPRTSVWPVKSAHLWAGALPEGLEPGYHTVEVRATSPYTSEARGARTFEVR